MTAVVTRTLKGRLTRGGGAVPIPNREVSIELVGLGFVDDGTVSGVVTTELVLPEPVVTDSNGIYIFNAVAANDDPNFFPQGTGYTIKAERIRSYVTVVVPSAGSGDVWVNDDIIVSAIGPQNPFGINATQLAAAIAAQAAKDSGTYVPQLPTIGGFTYNTDGSVASDPDGTAYAYNSDGTLATETLHGVTRTYSYNPDGSIAGVA